MFPFLAECMPGIMGLVNIPILCQMFAWDKGIVVKVWEHLFAMPVHLFDEM